MDDPVFLSLALLGVALFRIRNPYKKYLNVVTVLAGSTVIWLHAGSFAIDETIWWTGWWIIAGGLVASYTLRFSHRPSKLFIDTLKLVIVVVLALFPVILLIDYGLSYVLGFTFLPFPGMIYLYDRFILKPETMKRKFLIALFAQTLLILIMFIFSVYQKAQADKNFEHAEIQRHQAIENQKQAMHQEALQQETQQRLKECQGRKLTEDR